MVETAAAFEEALSTQPQWVQIWVQFLGAVIVITAVTLLFSKATRRDAVVIILSTICVYVAMLWAFQQFGFVRLLGAVHVVFWTPLAIYLYRRLRDPAIGTPFRQIIWLFLAAIIVSLAFDYADVIRYALGERASMLPA